MTITTYKTEIVTQYDKDARLTDFEEIRRNTILKLELRGELNCYFSEVYM